MTRESLSLSQFQTLLGNAIRMNAATRNVWVRAELSDVRVVGGHCYMELIEKDAAGRTQAKIRAMIWSNVFGPLRARFREATQREISSGIKVLVQGSATHHNLYGLSFTISDIDPDYTLGDLERQRREILERLAREGVRDFNRSIIPPVAPQRIAVISSAGAAGYGDFINQLMANPDGFRFYPVLFDAVMQGERTAPTVIEALDKIETTIDVWDMVVIIRGGGASSDLNGFDDYALARRVACFPLPVAVGIGHERDRNVLDEIACVRCKTPTAVAAWLVESLRTAFSLTRDIVSRIARYGTEAMRGEHIRLTDMQRTLPALAQARIMESKMRLSELSASLPALVQGRLMRMRLSLVRYAGRLEAASGARTSEASLALDRRASRLVAAAAAARQREKMRLERIEAMLRLLSPENTLRRGYSITRFKGRAVTDASAVPPGSVIETTFAEGILKSKTDN